MAKTLFTGECPSTLDPKGRFLFPAMLKKQVPAKAKDRFMIHRGYEKCLVMYAKHDWDIISAEVNKLNLHIKLNRDFARYFFRGVTELKLDQTNRLLLPKSLLDYATIKKDIMVYGYADRIEIWDEKLYRRKMDEEPHDYSAMAETVMGRIMNSQ